MKQMPKDEQTEAAFISALISDPEAFAKVSEITSEMFYNQKHKKIYSVIVDMIKKDVPIDLTTVYGAVPESLKNDVSNISDIALSALHIKQYAVIIKDKFIRRNNILALHAGIDKLYDENADLGETINQTAINLITAVSNENELISYQDALMETMTEIDNIKSNVSGVKYYGTGLIDFDKVVKLRGGKLMIIAGRPGHGKSIFAKEIAVYNADRGDTVLVCNVEMSTGEQMDRILSSDTGVEYSRLENKKYMGEADLYQVSQIAEQTASRNIFFSRKYNLSVFNIKAMAVNIKAQHGLDIIIIDYLQLLNTADKGKNREQQVSEMSRMLKILAQELNVTVILLSQLNRECEKRSNLDKMPQLSDLRECLSIDDWIYTPTGVCQLKDKPENVITCGAAENYCHSSIYIPKKYNTVYTVRTQFGQFNATANHLVLTGTGWKKVRDLNPLRDVVAAPNKIPHANKGYLEHGRLLGWLIGNGGLSGTPALIYRKELDTEVKKEADKFGVRVNYRKMQKSNNVYDTYLSNGKESGCLENPLMKWIRSLGLENKTCYDKFIPDAYMGSSDKTHMELLQGLWEADGSVTGGGAKYATVSEILARQIKWLLLTIGIKSTVTYHTDIWEVRCSASDNYRMSEIVNFPGRFGKLSIPSDDYIDPAPAIFVEMIDELCNSSYRIQKKISGEYKQISKTKMIKIMAESPLETIISSPYFQMDNVSWGRIASITQSEKEVRVADLIVPYFNNFVSDGVVVHNSGAIEQDADIVAFTMIPYKYGIEKIDSRELTENDCLLRVAKNRQGGTVNFIPIYFEGKTVSMRNSVNGNDNQMPF